MKIFFIGLVVVVLAALSSILFLSPSDNAPGVADADVIAQKGLHWHPSLDVYIKGVKQEIPQNLGLGALHQPMHTHEDVPIVHLEFAGIVRSNDIKLGRFFSIWGKDMQSFGTNMRMTVNGKENTEYESYVMQDGDKIELRYD